MSYSEYMWHHPIRKSISDRGQCRNSNKINGSLEKVPRNKVCVDLSGL